MKNTLHFFSSKLALTFFVMVGLFLFAPEQITAQATATTGSVKYNFVPENEAIEILELETYALRIQLENLVPGTHAYKTAISKVEMFTVVLEMLQAGKSVTESVETGLLLYNSSDEYASLAESIKTANRAELIVILSE